MDTNELEKKIKALTTENLELKSELKQLRKKELRYSRLNEIYPIGIFHTDTVGHNTYLNPKGCKIKGVSAEEALGYGWMRHVHPEDKTRVLATWNIGLRDKKSVQEQFRFTYHGRITWVHGETAPEFDENGKLIGYVGVIFDITKQREAENIIKKIKRRVAVNSRNMGISESVFAIAHQLNQPLTAISNFVSGCKRRLKNIYGDNLSRDILHGLDEANAQSKRAGSIIHSLLALLNPDRTNYEICNINSLIKQVIKITIDELAEKFIKVNLTLKSSIPDLNIDKMQIEQVIINIIKNSIDALLMNDRHNRIINVITENDGDFIKIIINDTGVGISKANLNKVFIPFYTTKELGTGIGLSLCYNIIKRHGGKISVESTTSSGTTFTIVLPDSLNDKDEK